MDGFIGMPQEKWLTEPPPGAAQAKCQPWKVNFMADVITESLRTPPRIIVDDMLVDQVRFPRSKKNRIRRKWAKRRTNYRPCRKWFRVGESFVCHPAMLSALNAHLAKQGHMMPFERMTTA